MSKNWLKSDSCWIKTSGSSKGMVLLEVAVKVPPGFAFRTTTALSSIPGLGLAWHLLGRHFYLWPNVPGLYVAGSTSFRFLSCFTSSPLAAKNATARHPLGEDGLKRQGRDIPLHVSLSAAQPSTVNCQNSQHWQLKVAPLPGHWLFKEVLFGFSPCKSCFFFFFRLDYRKKSNKTDENVYTSYLYLHQYPYLYFCIYIYICHLCLSTYIFICLFLRRFQFRLIQSSTRLLLFYVVWSCLI